MKFYSAISLLALVLLAACAPVVAVSPAAPEAPAEEDNLECPICSFDSASYSGPLDTSEAVGLLKALSDEYHALAVYDQVLADHGSVRPFSNIVRSEQQHIDALIGLFNDYGLAVPENPWVGQADSYDSVGAACAVGVEAEIANVGLYGDIRGSTDREDILRVYDALQRASNDKHLPAFERCAG